MAHFDIIVKNRSTLLRCINLSVQIVAGLREEDVIDGAQESRLEAEKAHHDKLCLLIDWIKECSDTVYESFLKVLEENEQQHVANLLRGKEQDNHVPLSVVRHARLLKIRRKLIYMIHNNVALIAELRSSEAISQSDAEELSVDKTPNYKKNFHLINVILRRSDYSFEYLEHALRSTSQAHVADYLTEGEVIPVHVNTTRPDLDEALSDSFNDTLTEESTDETSAKAFQMNDITVETTAKQIQMPHLNGLILAGATPGHSIVFFVYCKTTDNMVTFTKLYNSGELQTKLEDVLNQLLLSRIEQKSAERLDTTIRLDDEDILEIEEITGIEDWMKCEKIKSLQSGRALPFYKPTEVDRETSIGALSATTSHNPHWKQKRVSLYKNFERLLNEEETYLIGFLPDKSSEQDEIWKGRRAMLSEEFGQLFDAQNSIFQRWLSLVPLLTTSKGDDKTIRLRFKIINSRIKRQKFLWKSLKERVLTYRGESSSRSRFQSRHRIIRVVKKIDLLLQDLRTLKLKLEDSKDTSGKGNLFIVPLKYNEVEEERSKRKLLQIEHTPPAKRRFLFSTGLRKQNQLELSSFSCSLPFERSLSPPSPLYILNQPESEYYSSIKQPHTDAIQKNKKILLRCTTINRYVIGYLRAENVIDGSQKSDLETEINPIKQRILLFQWLKNVPLDKFESFLRVMKDTEQEHVANLLTGSTEDNHLPISDDRYMHLVKHSSIAQLMRIDSEVIEELRTAKAISWTDAREIRAETDDFGKRVTLINAVMRRSNYSYNSFLEVLRKTGQTTATHLLTDGEKTMPVLLDDGRRIWKTKEKGATARTVEPLYIRTYQKAADLKKKEEGEKSATHFKSNPPLDIQ